MNILLVFPGFIIALIIVLYYECNIRNISVKPKNKVHFYVARDKGGLLWLYIGKPQRGEFTFTSGYKCRAIVSEKYFSEFGLNENEYDNLKWEDEPVEVFVNMED